MRQQPGTLCKDLEKVIQHELLAPSLQKYKKKIQLVLHNLNMPSSEGSSRAAARRFFCKAVKKA